MYKKGLGRGLGALITERETESNEIKEILLTDIYPNPDQPRRAFDEEKLQELADSIKEHGLLQPILVKPDGNRYHIVAGERRYRASRLAGLDRINCIVKSCTELEMTERALIENIQRDDLSPVEEGMAYARLISEYGMTQEQVAKRVGKARSTITNLLRVTQLPEEILIQISLGHLSLGHAKVLLTLDETGEQIRIAEQIIRENFSVREIENILQRGKESENRRLESSEPKPDTKKKKPKQMIARDYDPLNDLEEKLQSSFQTKVLIKGNQEKGKIEIEYFTKEELQRLLEKWEVEL